MESTLLALEFIKGNISILKDLTNIMFWVIGTIIAVLTYKKANKAFLQPILTENVREKRKILYEILQLLGDAEKIDSTLGFGNLIRVNILKIIDDYEFHYNQSMLDKEEQETYYIGNSYFVNKKYFRRVKSLVLHEFTKEEMKEKYGEIKDIKAYNANNPKDDIIIIIPKEFVEVRDKIREFKRMYNLSKPVIKALEEIEKVIDSNLDKLSKVLLDLYKEDVPRKFKEFNYNMTKVKSDCIVNYTLSYYSRSKGYEEEVNKLTKEITKMLKKI